MPCYENLIVDLDGVVWRGEKPIEENIRVLSRFAASGGNIVFLTNNSTKSRKRYSQLLSDYLSIQVREEQVINSGYSAAAWLKENKGPTRTFIVGEEGLAIELEKADHTVLSISEWRKAEAVVVGLARDATYRRLALAHRAIVNGAMFIATNSDKSFPVEDGTEPGAGALISFLVASTGREPTVDTGKPGLWILTLALRRVGSGRVLVVGDRIDTDMEMAKRAGLDGLLVLTGITMEPGEDRWYYVTRSLAEGKVVDGRFCI